MTTTRTYDLANRLLKIESFNAQPSTLSSFNYDYNAANQRTLRREADGSYWRYEYDSLGQVISGKKYWSDGTPVPGQQFEYAFDDIGNRTGTKAGGDANGANLRNADYSANLLNQYTSRTVPGVVDVMGAGFATNTVTVNSQDTYRKGEYFRKEVSVGNSSTPVWQSITVSAAGQTNIAGNSFVVKTPEIFSYDLDGNLTNDGRWAYSWDAENRLVSMVARTSTGPQQRLDFGYDWRGRRIMKKVWNNTEGTGAPSVDRLFAYDGWNLIATLNPQLSTLNSFAWGLDLSGSLQGAGGVGGLLWVNDISTLNSQPSTHLVSFDGNGNVVALFNTIDSSETARYEYGPFGEVVRMTGSMARANPFRFSTKYQDDESDLLYYGYRYYSAGTGRWLSRDPKQERAGRNLCGFVQNNPISRHDVLGLWDPDCPPPPPPPPPKEPAVACCGDSEVAAGLKTLTERWRKATQYLDQNGVQLDPDDVRGVSCGQSANHILAFMAPVPKCWKCYIQRRGWNWIPWVGDENAILCEASFGRGWTAMVAFDWWFQRYERYQTYSPIPQWKYEWMFPYDLNPTGIGWWTKDNPAPHDDCVNKSPIKPERIEQLQALLPPYSKF